MLLHFLQTFQHCKEHFSQIGMQSQSDSYYANFEHLLQLSWSTAIKRRDSLRKFLFQKECDIFLYLLKGAYIIFNYAF
jgi:hypothetical protein